MTPFFCFLTFFLAALFAVAQGLGLPNILREVVDNVPCLEAVGDAGWAAKLGLVCSPTTPMITQPPPPPHVKATPWPTPTPPSATEGYRMPGPTPTPEPSPPLSAGLLTGIALTLVVSKALLTAPAHAHDAEVGAPAKAVAVKAVAAEVGAIEAHTVEVCAVEAVVAEAGALMAITIETVAPEAIVAAALKAVVIEASAVEAGTDVVELVRIPKNGDIGLGTDTLRNTNDNELPPEIPKDVNKGLSLVNSERADGDHLPREEECIDDEWQLVIIERAIPDVRLEPLEHAKGAPPVGDHVDDELLHEFSERAIDEPYSPTGSVAAQPMEPPAASDAANTVKPPSFSRCLVKSGSRSSCSSIMLTIFLAARFLNSS
ncbi:hypothetical protein GGI06_001537 [Coemansia sp. S85]|nr:hypothetical protein GGI06_001537 [Coemansia sp. S85]